MSHFVTQFSRGWMNNHSINSSLLIFINIFIDWFIIHTPDNVQNQNFKTSFYKNSTTNITIWQNQRISSSQSQLELHNTCISPQLMKWNGYQITEDLNTSSFKHLFNALLISLHSPRNFPTGCCKERRKKMCIQHKTKNMAKQARVYSTTRLTSNRAIECDVCEHWCHIKCGEISLREYRRLQNIQNFDWTCPSCISTLRTLPFADISNLDSSDGSFTSHGDDSCTEP